MPAWLLAGVIQPQNLNLLVITLYILLGNKPCQNVLRNKDGIRFALDPLRICQTGWCIKCPIIHIFLQKSSTNNRRYLALEIVDVYIGPHKCVWTRSNFLNACQAWPCLICHCTLSSVRYLTHSFYFSSIAGKSRTILTLRRVDN